jgi:rubrerythrin
VKIQPSLRIGNNRTGLAGAPERHGMLDVPPELGPTSRGTAEQIAAVRIRYAREGGPPGTMPREPLVAKELLLLLDLLGARLAFERGGVRLYDALISKHDAYGGFVDGPERRDLVQLRDEEHAHARMLEGLITEIGGDATAVTPCANREVITSRGICDVLVDPRTSLLDGLESIVVAELADREQWIGLVDIARDMNREDLARAFIDAQTTEDEHLSKVRAWIAAGRAAARDEVTRGRSNGNPPRTRT